MDAMTFAVRGGGESAMSSDEESKRDKRDSKDVEVEDRRNVLKGGIVVGGAAVAAALTLPKKWTRPLVEAVVVPAHAQTSPGAPTPSPTSAPTRPPTPSPTPSPTPGG
jgi:hypothetical protein